MQGGIGVKQSFDQLAVKCLSHDNLDPPRLVSLLYAAVVFNHTTHTQTHTHIPVQLVVLATWVLCSSSCMADEIHFK